MTTSRRIALVLSAVLIGLAVFTYGYVKLRGSAAENAAPSTSSSIARPLIATVLPARRTFSLRVPWVGTAETQASVELTALVAGRVVVIDAEDQRRLDEGQRVMRLGGPKIDEARAQLGARIESLGTQVDLARQTLERLKQSLEIRLATKDQLAAAQEAKVRLETQLRETRLSLQALENQINVAAPIDGAFTNRRVSVGQDVHAGQILGEIIDTGRLRIAASFFPPQGIKLQGKEANVRLSENRTLLGVVQRVLPRASSTGATAVWIEGPEIDAHLRPGQTVGGTIVVEVRSDSLAVPASAVVYDSQERPYLFVSQGGGYAPHSIQVGLEQDGWVEILSGLEQGQPVVNEGAYELFYREFNEQFKVQD